MVVAKFQRTRWAWESLSNEEHLVFSGVLRQPLAWLKLRSFPSEIAVWSRARQILPAAGCCRLSCAETQMCPFVYVESVAALGQSWVVATDIVWPRKPKILTIGPLTENVCQPLLPFASTPWPKEVSKYTYEPCLNFTGNESKLCGGTQPLLVCRWTPGPSARWEV